VAQLFGAKIPGLVLATGQPINETNKNFDGGDEGNGCARGHDSFPFTLM